MTVFKHLFLSIFIYKTLLNLTFLQVNMPVLSQENDGCPMLVVLWVKVLLCLSFVLCFFFTFLFTFIVQTYETCMILSC